MGRFSSEKEAQEYIASLETRNDELSKTKAQESVMSIRNVSRETTDTGPKTATVVNGRSKLREVLDESSASAILSAIKEEVRGEFAPILKKQRDAQDINDSKIVTRMPNYEKYIPAAKEFMDQNPNASILQAYKAVADPKDIARLDREVESEKSREFLKKSARGERSGDSGSVADPDSAKTLEKHIFGADHENKDARNFFGVIR